MTAQSPATAGERLTEGPAPALLRAALDAASEAVLLCDASDDTILLVNAAAQALVPGLTAGATALDGPLPGLAGALASGDDSFTDTHSGRHLQGRRQPLGDDHYAWFLRDRTDEVARADALRAERSRTAFLAEAGRRLSSSLHQGRCQRITAELAVAHLADAAMVVLPVNRRQSQWMRLIAGGTIEEGTLRERSLSDVPGLVEALGGFPPIPSKWLDASQAPEWLLPGRFGPIGALLVTPLPGNAEPAGALILARRGDDAEFSPEDEILARIFAARAGAAISAAGLYREQVDTTAVLQADLLPPELPQPDGIELVGSYQAAREALRIGGDFYDVFGPTENSSDTVIALGDVCGKGPEAAVLTGKVRQTLRALRLVGAPPDEMLRVLNRALLDSGRQHRFVTMVVGSVARAEHGRVRLTLATGGHPPPLVLRIDGRVEEVPTTGTLIGAVPRTVVNPADVELAPGELCLLYSDGLTEARGGPTGDEQFGEARLHDALAECRGMPAVATVERVRQLVSDWVHGGTRDDIAMLAVRAPARTQLSLRNGSRRNASPFAIDARRNDRRIRTRA
ncbi:SpoIIE family protein phosphatase [Actinoplanes sp. LDG1-06]|uniref:SpoIIE family protein phosphatase n=1 Tax=Paractinoplanes ovalisporus TaxID=2810368 RepID=A0ABS2ANM6_9ACTN|nr:PP2C family protein-serine/threonine phosphatase [Actinoplanes ovalisporus]MBM2621435.1 SpoIIE family protein phosphatase [Actinoplanes ovalisporus]